ncbi:MAG: ATP-binding domain-containing protein, partial [Methanomicrobiales archaeon]|nr:ATP-binding domain-containing protein [Methanomicrobiales archaeon]
MNLKDPGGTSRADVLRRLRTQFVQGDLEVERLAKEIVSEPQRFRGIAGSGKTHILCQRAAYMHCKEPDLRIVYTFFTRSLYGYIEYWVQFYCRMYGGEFDPDDPESTLKILHAWGGAGRMGFYRTLCDHYDIDFFSPEDLRGDRYQTPNELFARACKSFLQIRESEDLSLDPIFDAVLIDEGQDFVVDHEGLLYQGKQPFFWMAYQSLCPPDPERPGRRRLIWAYDEYQNTNSVRIPTSREIFGEEFRLRKSVIMRKCYRTPAPILMAAHAIGMGLFFHEGMLAGPTTKVEWNALGYDVEGEFKSGRRVRITRPEEYAANIVPDIWEGDLIDLQVFDRREEEVSFVARSIQRDITVNGLRPEDILVVSLNTRSNTDVRSVAGELMARGIETYISSAPARNRLDTGAKPDTFSEAGCVTISGINRAKGNEGNVVYILGCDIVGRNEESIPLRNSLFVAMTRSRAWVTLTGTGRYPIYEEMKTVLDQLRSTGGLTFTYRSRPRVAFDAGLDVEPEGVSYQ